jgi:hypothetical protein
VAVLGGGGENSSGGAASILPFVRWRVPQTLSKGRSAFQRIASAENNLQIIRSEMGFFQKKKNYQVTLARLNSPWKMLGSRSRKLKIAEQGQVSGRKLQQPAATRQ